MQKPLELTFRQIERSPALEAHIRKEVAKLATFSDEIIGCNVVFDSPHNHHHRGKRYQVGITLTVPEKKLIVKLSAENSLYEDAYVAIRDAFDAAQRQLEDYSRRRHRKVKAHSLPTANLEQEEEQ